MGILIVKDHEKMLAEEGLLKIKDEEFYLRKRLLKELYRIGNGQNTKLKRYIDQRGKYAQPLHLEILSHSHLKNIYWKLVKKLNAGPLAKNSYPTPSENKCADTLRRYSKIKFYQSFWIGNHCLDFYLPSFKLVIEVDGRVHYGEGKNKKDNYTEKELQNSFKIFVSRFDNGDISRLRETILNLIDNNKKFNSKAIKRLYRDIFIHTLACHCSIDDLGEYLGKDLAVALRLFKQIRRIKG